ncbi:hypothetical protein [Williamsia deligens]|uniref:Small CPxCG-related zinc finger protein n=1 Tax=Williamsia deligens TaxID=321325 RepID=A0ABW3GHR4_9NOCA|nr:hypothetical protein [Williamsia deligens]MCP2196302.1 hypothetical protein [Williamsia deligens]
MSDNVIPLRPDVYDGLTCEQCGEAWFQASVTVGRDGRVTGWVSTVKCTECDHLQVIA